MLLNTAKTQLFRIRLGNIFEAILLALKDPVQVFAACVHVAIIWQISESDMAFIIRSSMEP